MVKMIGISFFIFFSLSAIFVLAGDIVAGRWKGILLAAFLACVVTLSNFIYESYLKGDD